MPGEGWGWWARLGQSQLGASKERHSPRTLLSSKPCFQALRCVTSFNHPKDSELATIFILLLGPRRLVPGHTGSGDKRWSQAVWPKFKACPSSPTGLDLVQARTDALGHT